MKWGILKQLPNGLTNDLDNNPAFDTAPEGWAITSTERQTNSYHAIRLYTGDCEWIINVSTMMGNCGVASLSWIQHRFPWELLFTRLKELGYAQAICGVTNEGLLAELCESGWVEFSTFTNKRTGNVCYLLKKDL